MPFLRSALAAFLAAAPWPAAAQVAVATYHNDTYRTGWNSAETTLTALNAAKVALLYQVALDGQSDTQPLLVPGLSIGGATHDVAYVATSNNTLYAIDANSGTVLLQRNFGPPVPQSELPSGCGNNDMYVGITGTPVIDQAAGLLYLITYLYNNNTPSYEIHAVELTTLADSAAAPPQTIATSFNLQNKQSWPYYFQPAVTRQRAALLESKGVIYAGFASFCDQMPQSSRGWVLGWQAKTLAPLNHTYLTDSLIRSKRMEFLNAVWMSGYGIAADSTGNIYFATSNADSSGTSWNAKYNLSESVIRMGATLNSVGSYFTPTGTAYGWATSDKHDGDLGSGGVMLVPDAIANGLHLAVAAGKLSPVMLLDRDSLGGLGLNFLNSVPSGGCWCGPSYFTGSDGIGRIVTSTGNQVTIYQLQTSPSPALINPVSSVALQNGQDPGFFTSVSSNGTTADSAVVWAVTRPPPGGSTTVHLNAFNAMTGARVLSTPGGTWANLGANANIVPTVANGHVYVAAYKSFNIFGLPGAGAQAITFQPPAIAEPPHIAPHRLTGAVVAAAPGSLTLQLRDGRRRTVAISDQDAAIRDELASSGTATVLGDVRNGTFVATSVTRAKKYPGNWPADW